MAVQLNKAKSFFDRVLQTVPEAQREALRSDYSAAQDEIAAAETTLEEATTRVNQTAQKQTDWYRDNKTALEKAKEVLANSNGNPNGTHTIDPAIMDKRIGDLRDEVMGNGLALISAATTIATSHLNEFKEPLDMTKLAQDAIKANMSLQSYYDQTVATRRAERDAATRKAEIDAAEARGKQAGVQETLAKLPATAMPYPVGSSAPTTLAGLRKPAEGQPFVGSLDAAVATANAEMAKQT